MRQNLNVLAACDYDEDVPGAMQFKSSLIGHSYIIPAHVSLQDKASSWNSPMWIELRFPIFIILLLSVVDFWCIQMIVKGIRSRRHWFHLRQVSGPHTITPPDLDSGYGIPGCCYNASHLAKLFLRTCIILLDHLAGATVLVDVFVIGL